MDRLPEIERLRLGLKHVMPGHGTASRFAVEVSGGPRGFHRIRHYGLLAGSARKAGLALARELLNVTAPSDDTPAEPYDFRPPCPCCGGRMIVIEAFERWRQPRGPPRATATNREKCP